MFPVKTREWHSKGLTMCVICVASRNMLRHNVVQLAFAGAHRDVRLRAAGKHRLVRKLRNSAIQILVSLNRVCAVGILKNLLCTSSKTGFKNSQDLLDYGHRRKPATSRNNENFAIICTIMMY